MAQKQDDMELLSNNTWAPASVIADTMSKLHRAWIKDPATLHVFWLACKGNTRIPGQMYDKIADFGLINDRGEIDPHVKNITLSAVKEGADGPFLDSDPYPVNLEAGEVGEYTKPRKAAEPKESRQTTLDLLLKKLGINRSGKGRNLGE